MNFLSLLASAATFFSLEMAAPLLPDHIHTPPKYSPNEQHLAYLAPDERGAYNIHVDGKCMTRERKHIVHFQWEKDGTHLLYCHDPKGDENTHLYRLDLEGRVEDLTPIGDHHAEFYGTVGEKALVGMNVRDPHYFDFYQIDLESHERMLVLGEKKQITDIGFDKEGNPKAVIIFDPSGAKFLEVNEDGEWKRLWDLSPDDFHSRIWGFSQDEKKIRILSSRGLPAQGMFEIDLQTGESSLIFADPIFDGNKFYFDPITDQLQAVYIRGDYPRWHFIDPAFGKEILAMEQSLGEGSVSLLNRLSDEKKWFVSHQRSDRPTKYYLWDREEQSLTLVLEKAPELSDLRFAKMEPIHFQASDGLMISGYFLRPLKGEPPYPTIVQIHGGPHLRYESVFIPDLQYWIHQGYALLVVNYRGSSGYGTKFLTADFGEWGEGRMCQDVIEGKRWAVNAGLVDPGKVILRGGSMGGYLTLLGLCTTPKEFLCGIAMMPLIEPETRIRNEEYPIWESNGEKWYREAPQGSKTPIDLCHRIKDPLLMIHSDNDLRVNLKQSQRMAAALVKHQIPFSYHILRDDGHFLLDPDNRRLSLELQTEFLETVHKP